ncbi:hypothetical protein BRC2024_KCUCJSVR_CDS_0036 [Acinetobacter phage vB_AbaM_KissB]
MKTYLITFDGGYAFMNAKNKKTAKEKFIEKCVRESNFTPENVVVVY